MKVGLLVNDVIPGLGLPCSGQGIRAWGLLQGLRANGVDASVIIRHSTMSTRINRWHDIMGVHLPEHLVIANHAEMPNIIGELDYLVFHNWAAGKNISRPEDSDVRFVYDFFSATLVEHSFISADPAYLDGIRAQKQALVEQSDIFIANGPGRRDYGAEYLQNLGIEAPVHDIPTSLPWLGETEVCDDILIGGYQQDWTKPLQPEMAAALSAALPDRNLVTVGADMHYHFGRRDKTGASAWPDSLLRYDILSFEDYASLNARAAAFVDIAPLNAERRISFSTRGVMSLASGCPIVHNAETDLGRLVAQYDAGVVLGESDHLDDPQTLAQALKACLDARKRENCRALWVDVFDCRVQATHLLKALQDA